MLLITIASACRGEFQRDSNPSRSYALLAVAILRHRYWFGGYMMMLY